MNLDISVEKMRS